MTEGTIDDILNGEPAPEPQIEEVAEAAPEVAEPEATEAQPRDEHGRFAPKGEKQPEAQAEPVPAAAPPAAEESQTVPRTALQDERRKRQELERQLQEISQRLTQQPVQPQPIPDQWDDPEGFARHLAREAAAQAREEALAELRRERVIHSAEAAKQRHPDYIEKVDTFNELAAQNPALIATMMQQPDPAEYAYNIAKQHEELNRYGSLDAMLEAKKKEWEAEALEGLKASLDPAPASAPTSLVTERNVGSRSGPAWSGPADLSELLR